MKTIHYAGEEYLTGDDLADAVVEYAKELARHDTSASIDVPVITADGSVVDATFLLGPASQLVAVPTHSDLADPVDLRVTEFITLEMAKLEPLEALPTEDRDEDRFDYGI